MSYHLKNGEFKKRMEGLLNHLAHNGYNDGYHIKESDVAKFWNIFVEAEKEFPNITNYKTENYWRLHLKRVEWTMKWFGVPE